MTTRQELVDYVRNLSNRRSRSRCLLWVVILFL